MLLQRIMPLFLGFIIDLIVGDPYWIPHPICFIGKLIKKTENILRKNKNLTAKQEQIRGFFLCIIVISISTIIPFLILYFGYKINFWIGILIETIMCWQILATKCLLTESMKVYYSLKSGDINKSRYNVSMIVGRDTENLNSDEITKATIETVAENTTDGVVAPIIFVALFGACGGFFYKSINTMDSMIAYKNDKYINFGRYAAKLDDIMNYIPSRITAIIMIISSFILRFNYKNAFKIFIRDRYKHASPNSAQTESVCAGALEIQLAGDAIYGGKITKKDYIGDKIKPITFEDIKNVNKLMYLTAILTLIIVELIKIITVL